MSAVIKLREQATPASHLPKRRPNAELRTREHLPRIENSATLYRLMPFRVVAMMRLSDAS